MRVSELFRKPPATLPADATLSDAATLMDEKVVGAIVVVDDGRPVGIVTDRDIVLRGVANRLPSDARVDAVMSTDLVTIPADADITVAMSVFEERDFRRLPLVDIDDRVVGMITVDDLVVHEVAAFSRLLRPVVGQVLFGHPEPKVPVPQA
jgi:CBS domain-containing protein